MKTKQRLRLVCFIYKVCTVLLAGLLGIPATGMAQTVSGHAKAVRATIVGMTDSQVLVDTGRLGNEHGARDASSFSENIAFLGDASILHAVTVSSIYGWDMADFVASEASLADINLNIGNNVISADFIMSETLARVSGVNSGSTSIDGLLINGTPVKVTGAANQTIPLLTGKLIINEQQSTANGGLVVNAIHIVIDGVADVVLASASAAVRDESTQESGSGGVLKDLGF